MLERNQATAISSIMQREFAEIHVVCDIGVRTDKQTHRHVPRRNTAFPYRRRRSNTAFYSEERKEDE